MPVRVRKIVLAGFAGALCLALCACSEDRSIPGENSEPINLFEALLEFCGAAFAGRITSNGPPAGDWAGQSLIMHVRDCSADEIGIAIHAGNDRSRIWVLSRTELGFHLRHDQHHQDGSPLALSGYGGDAWISDRLRIEFTADAHSLDLFEQQSLNSSTENIWGLEFYGQWFVYEWYNPDQYLRMEFDLSNPVETPPAPWGFED